MRAQIALYTVTNRRDDVMGHFVTRKAAADFIRGQLTPEGLRIIKQHEPEVMTRGGFKPVSQTDECRKAAFLDDPITEAYGVGYEMLSLIECTCPQCAGARW